MKTSQTGLMDQICRVLFHREVESKENRAPQVGGGCLANLTDASKSNSRRGQRQKCNRHECDRAASFGTSVLENIHAVPQRNASRVENSDGGLLSRVVVTENENTQKVKRSRNDSLVTSSLLGVESQSRKPSKKGRGRKSRQQLEQVNVSQGGAVSRSDAMSLVPTIRSSNISVLAGEPFINPRRKAPARNIRDDSGSVLVALSHKSRDNSGWPMASGDSDLVSASSAASLKALKRKKTRIKHDALPLRYIGLTAATTKKAEEDDMLMMIDDSPESDGETKPTKRKDTKATPSKLATSEATLVDLTNAIDSMTLCSPMEETKIVFTNTIDSRAPTPSVTGEEEGLPSAIDSPAIASPMKDEEVHLVNTSDSFSLAPSAKDEMEARVNVLDPLPVTFSIEDEVDDYTIAVKALASSTEVGKEDHTIVIEALAPFSRVDDEEEPTKPRTRLRPGSRVFDLESIPISSFHSPCKDEVTKAGSYVIVETEEQEMRRPSRRQVPTDRFSPSLAMKQVQVKAAKYSSEQRDQSVSLSKSETITRAAVNNEIVEQVKRRSGRRQMQTEMFSPSAAMKEAQLKASAVQGEPKRQRSKAETTKSILRKKQRKDLPPKSRRKASIDGPWPDEKDSSSNKSHVLDPVEAMQLASPLSYLSQKMQEMQAYRNDCQEEETDDQATKKKPSSGSDLSKKIQAVTMNTEAISSETPREAWNKEQLLQLQQWQSQANPTSSNFWVEISEKVDGKSAQECREKWFSLVKTPKAKRAAQKKKDRNEPVTTDALLDTNDEDDVFNSTPLRGTLFPIDTKMKSEEMNNIDLDVGSPVMMSARRDRRVSTEYDDDGNACPSVQHKVGYKSYLMGLKRGLARAKHDKKNAKEKQNSAIGTARNITESVGNGDVSLKCRLSPGGTLEVENLTEFDVEDDFMCCSSDSSDCDE